MNVWVALTWEGHIHHTVARTWFQGLDATARLSFCRFTQISLLRLLTTRAVMGDDVITQAEAWEKYDQWLSDDRIVFVEEPANVEPAFRALSRRPHSDAKVWADAYLAAFAAVAGMQLVTFDHAFEGRVERLLIFRP